MTKRVNTHASANGMTPRFLFAFASNVDSIVTESGEEENGRPGRREWRREGRTMIFSFSISYEAALARAAPLMPSS